MRPQPSADEQAGPSIRVLVVEDHQVVAEGLGMLLGDYPDFDVVGWTQTVAGAVRAAREEQVDVVLMDFSLPDGSGADAAREIRAQSPGTQVLFLSANGDDDALLEAVAAGACGYLLKTEAAAQLVNAVRRAATGEMLIPPETLARLLARQKQRSALGEERQRVLQSLTRREREVLAMMAKGLDNNTIAADMHLSVTTVRGYVQHLLEKLSVHSKLEAVARASEYGLLER